LFDPLALPIRTGVPNVDATEVSVAPAELASDRNTRTVLPTVAFEVIGNADPVAVGVADADMVFCTGVGNATTSP